jgi:hypothetical protein
MVIMTNELQPEAGAKLQQMLGVKSYDFLGYTVNLETGELTDHLSSSNKMLANTIETLLNHYAAGNPSPLSGILVKYRDFPGGCAYEETFIRRAVQPVADVFGENPKEIIMVAERLGGKPLSYGDASVEIEALKGIPLTYVVYAKEEYPASVSIFYDASAKDYLPTEDLAVLGEVVTIRLLQAKNIR